MFYSMIDNCLMNQWQKFSIFGTKQVMWKYTLLLSTLPTRKDNFKSFSADY